MKRKLNPQETAEVGNSQKKHKDNEATMDVEDEALELLEPIQAKLLDLDDECVKEQLKVQRIFADQMRPLFLERQKIFAKIPMFWFRVLANLPVERLFCNEDREILENIESIDLEDNLDERGSYKLTMTFKPEVAEFFEPSVLEKTVHFDEKGRETKSSVTQIRWKPDKNIVELVRERRRKYLEEKQKQHDDEEDEDDDEDDDAYQESSLFEWFTETANPDCIPLGDILRRDVWQNPVIHLFPQAQNDEEYSVRAADYDFGDDES